MHEETEIRFNVTLTEDEKALVKDQIVKKRNRVIACNYAGIRPSRLNTILAGGTLKNTERDLLLGFCNKVNGVDTKTVAA